jgi:hypothetical protein
VGVRAATEELEIDIGRRRLPARLRRAADQLDRKHKRVAPPEIPPFLAEANDDALVRIAEMRIEIRRLEMLIQIRDWLEWKHVWASPDALRHFADLAEEKQKQVDDEKARREREREEQRRRWQRSDQERYPLDVLDLPASASSDEIKARYRDLLKRLHPDTNGGDGVANGLLRQVTSAVDRLRDTGRVR